MVILWRTWTAVDTKGDLPSPRSFHKMVALKNKVNPIWWKYAQQTFHCFLCLRDTRIQDLCYADDMTWCHAYKYKLSPPPSSYMNIEYIQLLHCSSMCLEGVLPREGLRTFTCLTLTAPSGQSNHWSWWWYARWQWYFKVETVKKFSFILAQLMTLSSL